MTEPFTPVKVDEYEVVTATEDKRWFCLCRTCGRVFVSPARLEGASCMLCEKKAMEGER